MEGDGVNKVQWPTTQHSMTIKKDYVKEKQVFSLYEMSFFF